MHAGCRTNACRRAQCTARAAVTARAAWVEQAQEPGLKNATGIIDIDIAIIDMDVDIAIIDIDIEVKHANN